MRATSFDQEFALGVHGHRNLNTQITNMYTDFTNKLPPLPQTFIRSHVGEFMLLSVFVVSL